MDRINKNKENLFDKKIANVRQLVLENIEVLVVEDNNINHFVANAILSKAGAKPEIAINGKVALEKLKQKNFDLVLMDIQMPIMNGFETTRIIRNEFPSPLNKIPVIAMTVLITEAETEKFLEAGMDDFLSKPIDISLLLKKAGPLISRFHKDKQDFLELKQKLIEQEKSFDLTYVHKILNDDPEEIKDMLDLFIEVLPQNLLKLELALKKDESEKVRHFVHKLRSTFGIIGAKRLLDECTAIESNIINKAAIQSIPDKVRKVIVEAGSLLEEIIKVRKTYGITIRKVS